MKKYVYILFFMYGSMNAVPGLQRDSRTVVFEEHPPAKVVNSFDKKNINENDKQTPCLDSILESEECTPIFCAGIICFADGLGKVCSASKGLLVCVGLLP